MSKYPCGLCSVGVKYNAIRCTGICKLWYHAQCVNLSSKELNKFAKMKPPNWECTNCKTSSEINTEDDIAQAISTPVTTRKEKNITNHSLFELEQSLAQNEVHDMDESLKMAAKIGSALLEEKSLLEVQNSKLAQNLKNLEAKVEELENSEQEYLNTIENLHEKIAEAEIQYKKEKQRSIDIQLIFEEHDKKQSLILEELQEKMIDQEKLITSLKRKLQGEDCKEEQKSLKNIEVQTDSQLPPTLPSVSQTILELGLLRTTQDLQARKLKTLEEKYETLCGSNKKDTDITNRRKRRKKGVKIPQNNFSVSLQIQKAKLFEETTNANKIDLPTKEIRDQNQSRNPSPIIVKESNQVLLKAQTYTSSISDDEDSETNETRTTNVKMTRNMSLNSNSGRTSYISSKNSKSYTRKEKNSFSVSRQVAKRITLPSESEKNPTTRITNKNWPTTSEARENGPGPNQNNESGNQLMPVDYKKKETNMALGKLQGINPPITAKLLNPGETHEQFFNQYIEEYKVINKMYNKSGFHSKKILSDPFLEPGTSSQAVK